MAINRRLLFGCTRRNSIVVLLTLNVCMVLAVLRLYSGNRERVITVFRQTKIATDIGKDKEVATTGSVTVELDTTIPEHTTTPLPDLKLKNFYYPRYIPDCPPEEDKLLVGKMAIDFKASKDYFLTMLNISQNNTALTNDEKYLGQFLEESDENKRISVVFEPGACNAVHSVAIIIPFRNREEHLRILLGHLMPVLQRQLLRFGVFVATQQGNGTFNKGRIMNTAFQYAIEAGNTEGRPFDCFVFHDVDLLAEYDTLFYRCTGGDAVNHFSTAIDKFGYKERCCGMTVGGVLAFTQKQYKKVNGYSNEFWGWGGEDDDMANRISNRNLNIARPDSTKGRYTMVKHKRDGGNPNNEMRMKLLQNSNERLTKDGLSSLDTKITSIHRYPLFINLNIDVGNQS
ncbi:beta-1,4-galactosyltransferase 2-like [Styela clava]